MRVDLFDFDLPPHLIATEPLTARDAAKMLVVDPSATIQDDAIANLTRWLKPGDVLVVNNTKVMHARLFGQRGEAAIELLLHQPMGQTSWKAFAKPAKKLKHQDEIILEGGHLIRVVEKLDDGQVLLDMRLAGSALNAYLETHGHVPLPPYIQKQRQGNPEDKTRYQTIYSDEQQQRSVAAPTAGLHFTDALLAKLKAAGIHVAQVTLHVGAGTFLPVKADNTANHIMHSESWSISQEAADLINTAKMQNGRVIAVGTTSLRALESAAADGRVTAGQGDTNLFITPGYDFQIVDVLLTNFHLPKSTLFMLISAFCGLDVIQSAYRHAIDKQYRFYSYGDACLLHRAEAV